MPLMRLASIVFVFAWLTILPSAAYAQASITGVVRDTSGAVLPGVTVEAASPVLIEKVRSVVTDGTGQYRIENLRPGAYTVTFTLPGFATVRREGIQLTGTFVATVNAELRVGALEETITVTGETPIVDVQSTTRQRVLNQEILEGLPSSRNPAVMAGLMPGVTATNQDVGGIRGMGPASAGSGSLSVRGVSDTRMQVSGVSLQVLGTGGGNNGGWGLAAYEEVVVDTGGIGAEQKEGGVRMNLIPREGGNTPRGYFLGAFANHSMQGNNFIQDLQDRGLRTPDSLKRVWDLNPAFGGPIKQDKLWYHATIRYTGAQINRAMFFNKNAGNPNAWTYEPDTSRPAQISNVWRNLNARITWQATPRNKVAVSYDQPVSAEHPREPGVTVAPEATLNTWAELDPKRLVTFEWTSPATNRLLFEAVVLHHVMRGSRPTENVQYIYPEYPPGPVKLNAVTEQSNNLRYRATSTAQNTWNQHVFWRAAASYITGAHALKVGFNYGRGIDDQVIYALDSPMSFRFNNGVPNQLALAATPWRTQTHFDADHGLFVQDKWTVHRLTLTAGLRYDYFHVSYPETTIGSGEYAPTRNFVFAAADGVRWHDLEPRSGLAFDVFGDGKTALKVSLNKYLANESATFGRDLAPASRLVNTTNRSWNDANRNFVPDCDLLNPAANGECGAMSNPDFGSTRPGRTYDPETLRGWNKREYNWQFSTGVQRELVPRVSLDVSYFRTWVGNFVVTDDRAVGPSDYDRFSITAPVDPRLPGGGGYAISGLYDLKPAAFGRPADNYLTFADNYGKQIRHWNGVDVSVNMRPRPGVLLQGGTNTQRRSTDNCDVVRKVDNPSPLYCHITEAFRTQVKFLATYTVPRIDVQLSASLQSMPGPQILANYVATNAVVAPSLGRNLAGGERNVTVNVVEPGTMYGERMNQLDLRFGKILTFGRTRVTTSLDLYNALNANAVLAQSNAFATWQRPEAILTARFAKVVVQLNF